MSSFLPSALFSWIVEATLKGSVVIILVAAIVALCGRRLGAQWRYALWLVVILRLAMPVALPSSLSIFNVLERIPGAEQARAAATAESFERSELVATAADVLFVQASPKTQSYSILLTLWALGVAFLLIRLAGSTISTRRAIARARRGNVTSSELRALVDGCRQQLSISQPVEVIVCETLLTPALHGLVRPRLLLPAKVAANFEARELRHIILHELWHLRRYDVAVNWVLTLVQALHWFNPLVWFAVARIREEREITCDELALSCLEEEERIGYGRTILKLLEGFRTASRVPALVGIVPHKRQMKRRLIMISSFQKRRRSAALYIGAVAFIGTVAFTDANGSEQRVIKKMNLDPAAAESIGKLEQRVSVDLTNASFGELLNTVAANTGTAITQSPEIASSPVQQARFTLSATNVPAHLLLMQTLTPFDLSAEPNANGAEITKGAGCGKMSHREIDVTTEDGKTKRKVIHIHTKDEAAGRDGKKHDRKLHKARAGAVEHRVMVRAMAKGECELSADGKLHRELTVKVDENGTVSEGKLQLDIDAPPSAK